MDDYIWLFQRESKRDFALAVVASIGLHLLMIAIMATTSIFIPRIGKSQKLDIFWLYPPFLYGTPTIQATRHPASSDERKIPPMPELVQKPPTQPEKKPVTETILKKEPPPPPPKIEKTEPEPPVEAEMKYPAAEKPEPAAKPEIKPVPVVAEAAPQQEPVPAKAETPALKEALPPAEKGVASPQTVAEKGPAEPATPGKEAVGPAGTAEVAKAVPSPGTGAGTESGPATAEPGALPGEAAGGLPAQEEIKSEQKEPQKPETPSETSKRVGIVTPPVFGDLKLVITGKSELLDGIGISVKFRPYPKSSHSRPLTRAESGRSSRLVPTHARPNENTVQAVIVTASDGIYDFILESGAASPVSVDFYLNIFENTGKAANRHIGTRTVSNNASIARVLMPEGVLWDDDSAFSGNLEDSDSISKFNTETGLFWKEYK